MLNMEDPGFQHQKEKQNTFLHHKYTLKTHLNTTESLGNWPIFVLCIQRHHAEETSPHQGGCGLTPGDPKGFT